jgi:flagellar protein FlaG
MSSETIVTALFLISAVVAAGILINSIFPAIYRTTNTFGSVSHEAEAQLRTDIRIVNTFANATTAKAWVKNVGSMRISANELDESDIFVGAVGNFERIPLAGHYTIEGDGNSFWDPGETLSIMALSTKLPATRGEYVYFSIVLPNGVKRSEEFTSS